MDCLTEESYLIERLKKTLSEKIDPKNAEKLEKRKSDIQNLRGILTNSIENSKLEEILQSE
jgi:PHD/YefM family antitoxin component YafN of YafNO toxin-antitoxin module